MAKEPVFSAGAPAPSGGYSQGIRAGRILYLSGQGPGTAAGDTVQPTFGQSVRQVFANLDSVARAAGMSLADAVKINVYIESMDDFNEMDRIYREVFPQPWPARTTVQVGLGGIGIEVDAVLWSDREE
ncbi:MAG: RidA family protein [Acidimicrobiia bacterium]|nr:RidA family protein [Acidimicrobiia bacterium]